jgi:hypothetical protein
LGSTKKRGEPLLMHKKFVAVQSEMTTRHAPHCADAKLLSC